MNPQESIEQRKEVLPLAPLSEKMFQARAGEIVCPVNSEADYQAAGQLYRGWSAAEKWWLAHTKSDPGKPPTECEGFEGIYFFAYQALQRSKKLVDEGLAFITPRKSAAAEGIRVYDERKQAALLKQQQEQEREQREREITAERARIAAELASLEAGRKRQAAEDARLAAERAANARERQRLDDHRKIAEQAQRRAEVEASRRLAIQQAEEQAQQQARERAAATAGKREEIARGPEGTTKTKKFIITQVDMKLFAPWAIKTDNFHLLKLDEGLTTKLVNALAGENTPPGISIERQDIIRRSSR